jgi:hypothetical protein
MKLPLTLISCAAVATLISASSPVAAFADSVPSYAAANSGETIHGTISSAERNDVYVRDDRGFIDHVELHDGTVISPLGLTLGAGETVTITGHNAGPVFRADEVDAANAGDAQAYDNSGPDQGYQPYGDGSYPYDYGYPYAYGYGYGYPGFYGGSVGFYFGGGSHRGGYYGHGYSGRGSYGGGSYGRGSYGGGSYGRGSYGRGSYGRGGVSGGSFGRNGSFGRGASAGGGSRGGSSRR